MKILLIDSNAVLAANDVNLSIFKPTWLVREGILRQDEVEGNIIVSPVTVQISTPEFQLTVLPNRIQMSFPGPGPGSQSVVDRVASEIARKLPHTPYSGCGLNFNYLLAPEKDADFGFWCRHSFASSATGQVCENDSSDSRFGSYCSFDALGARLKLDIKPTRTTSDVKQLGEEWEPKMEVMRMNFNYHFNVEEGDKPVDQVIKSLDQWDAVTDHTHTVIDRIA